MAKYLAQLIVLGAQAVGRAFARAVRQEIDASQQAAARMGHGRAERAAANAKAGMTLEEALQILNASSPDSPDVEKNYKHLFEVNDKARGGTLYLQSKVYRAFERVTEERKIDKQSNPKATSTGDTTGDNISHDFADDHKNSSSSSSNNSRRR